MQVLCLLIQVYIFVLLGYVILSYVPRPPEPILPLVRGIRALVDPVLVPLRRVVPALPLGSVRLDLSIIIVFVVLNILAGVVC